ncbi:MAG: TonB-dependent receptor [Sphingomonadaceae bacterium]
MNKVAILGLASVSTLAFATPVYAQEAQGASTDDSVIIVTARRKEESIQDVPLNIQAVGGDDLEKLQIREFENLTALVPGLSLDIVPSGIGGVATMRGIDFSSNASGSATSVEFYRNDAPTTPSVVLKGLYDIGQIEVLRGPQGTLRGRASPSGSITITTKKPILDEAGGYLSGTVDDQHGWNVNGAINVPIISEKLGVRLAGFVDEGRGSGVYGLNVQTGEIDRNIFADTQSLRASVRANPFDDVLLLDFNYEVIDVNARQFPNGPNGDSSRSESFSNVNPAAGASPILIRPGDDLSANGFASTSESTSKIYNWQAQLNLFGQSLVYVGSRTDVAIDSYASDDYANLFAVNEVNGTPFGQTNVIDNHPTRSHELRLQNDDRVLGIFDYVVGALWLKQGSPTVLLRATGIGSPAGLLAVSRSGTYRFRVAEEESYFGNLTAHITDRLEVSGGIRRIKASQYSGVALGPETADIAQYDDSRTAGLTVCYGYGGGADVGFASTYDFAGCDKARKATIYNASIKYQVTDNAMVYASYGTSWRPGNSIIGYRGAVGPFLNQFLNLADEESESYEIGFKTSWMNDQVRFNVSAYRQTFKNFPYRLGTPVISLVAPDTPSLTSAFNFVVPAEPKIKGFEAELSYDPSDNFFLSANVSYADSKISGASVPCVDIDNDNIQDSVPPSAADLLAQAGANQVDICQTDLTASVAPKWQGSVQAEYSMPFGATTEGFIRGLASWKGSSVGELTNQFDDAKSYSLIDLFAGVRDPDGAWDVTLFAKNVFDVRRVTSRTGSAQSTVLLVDPATRTSAAFDNTQYVGIDVTRPREFGVTVRVAFGSR